jgi:DNA-binding response OmpR family regulator
MKVLHVAQDRSAAELTARALHGIAHDLTLQWTQAPVGALQWLWRNSDTAAVIVQLDAANCAFVQQVRKLGLTTPVVVVSSSSQFGQMVAALDAGADEYVTAGPSLESDLPRIIGLAIERSRARTLQTRTLAELAAERDQLKERTARAEEAREQMEQRCASELAAAAAHLSEFEARRTAAQARDARICAALQERLFQLESGQRNANERTAADAVGFADQLAKRHAEFTASLAQISQSRDALSAQLSAATAALDDTQHARRAEADSAAELLHRREAELTAARAEAAAVRMTLESALAEAEAAHRETARRAESALAAANERQAALEDLLGQETDRRTDLEKTVASASAAHQQAHERHMADMAAAAARISEFQARYDAALGEHASARETFDQRAAQAAASAEQATREAEQARAERDMLRQTLDESRAEAAQLHAAIDEERRSAERAQLVREAELTRVSEEYGQLRQSFAGLQAAFQTLEQIAGEHGAERARLERVVADRDSALTAQAERHRRAEQAAQEASAVLQEKFRQTLDTNATEIARLQHEVGGLRGALDEARTRADAFRHDAERLPDLLAHLELNERERRREFERAPYGLCRCTPAGVITDANHSFVTMVGRRRVDELRQVDFATVVSDHAGDLGWLLERARAMRKTESVETSWKTGDGRHLIVRLRALAVSAGSIEIMVEDLTGVRGLEDRLRQAQRLEAVGRLASEVAATCGAMLRDASGDARDWQAAIGDNDAVRRQGDRLVGDLDRAASFMRQLEIYGHEQVRALEPVSVQRVLRDLAPVLKQVVGDRIELMLSKSFGSFDVDVEAARLERVLVNVAAYARQRMPDGGQMRIDLATIAVGRRFVARYPSVRPGDHVLITVAELPADDGLHAVPARESERSEKTGVDLGALVDLVATCGGHLWMEAQPAGNMVVKIHLPKRAVIDAPALSRATGPGPQRVRRLARWFRSGSEATGTRA